MSYLTEENKLHLPKYNVLVTILPPKSDEVDDLEFMQTGTLSPSLVKML
jgi:hypothetical protein